MKKIFVLIVALSISFSLIAETLNLVSLDYPPYQYVKDGEVAGYVQEFIRVAFKESGFDLDIRILPWEESLQLVKDKEADGIFTIFKTKKREDFLIYSDVVLVEQQTGFFTLKESTLNFKGDLAELEESCIGVVNSVSYGDIFDNAVSGNMLKTKVLETTEDCIKALINGEIDLFINNVGGSQFILKEMDLAEKIVQNGVVLERIPSYLAFSKTDEMMKMKIIIDKKLRELKDKGLLEKLKNDYGK